MRLIQTDIEDIRRLYDEEGFTLKRIAERLGISKQTIRRRLSKAGARIRPRAVAISIECELLRQLYVADGLSLQVIGERLGVAANTTALEVRRHGIKRRRTSAAPRPGLEREIVSQLYLTEGLTLAQVGIRLGVSATVVSRELKRHGIQVRGRGVQQSKHFERDVLHELYIVKGLSLGVVGSMLGVNGQTISNQLRRHGIKRRKSGPKPLIRDLSKAEDLTDKATSGFDSSDMLEQIKRFYTDGQLSPIMIAKRIGVPVPKVYNLLLKSGIELRHESRPRRTIDREILVALFVDEKLTITKIAKKLNSTNALVTRELERHSVEVPALKPGRQRKPSALDTLSIGETIVLDCAAKPLYDQAKSRDIKVSVLNLEDGRVRVTRTK